MGILSRSRAYIGPEKVQIDITNRCNNNCLYCWARSPLLGEKEATEAWKGHELPVEIVKDLIDDLHRLGTRNIHIAGGGEPFMHPQLLNIIAYIKRKGLRCEITTNMTLIDKAVAEKVVELGVDHLTASLWAADALMYVRLHPGKTEEDFYHIVDILKWFNFLKQKQNKSLPVIRLSYVISNINYRDIRKMVMLVREVGANSYLFQVMDAVAGCTDSLLLTDVQRQEAIKILESLKGERASLASEKNIIGCEVEEFMRRMSRPDIFKSCYDEEEYKKMPCYAGWLFSRVTAEGNVNFCLKTDEYPIGNLYKESFRKIWCSQAYADFRQDAFWHKQVSGRLLRCNTTCDNRHDNLSAHFALEKLAGSKKLFLNLGKSIIR